MDSSKSSTVKNFPVSTFNHLLTTMVKGLIQEVKDELKLVFQLQVYCNKWMSDDYLFDVMKDNYHYSGNKSTVKRAMTSLKDDYPYIFNINPKIIKKNRICFYYVSPKGISSDVSNLSHSDWESIYEHKRVTRAPTNNKSATVTCADDELSSDLTSKHR